MTGAGHWGWDKEDGIMGERFGSVGRVTNFIPTSNHPGQSSNFSAFFFCGSSAL